MEESKFIRQMLEIRHFIESIIQNVRYTSKKFTKDMLKVSRKT